jgi:hypothetical protein
MQGTWFGGTGDEVQDTLTNLPLPTYARTTSK